MAQNDPPDFSFQEAVRVQAEASQKLSADVRLRFDDPALSIGAALNHLLEGRMGPFKTDEAEVTSSDGEAKVGPFAVVLHKGDVRGAVIPIDGVAAVVDAIDELTPDNLRVAYDRAQQIKAMTKKAAADGSASDPTSIAMTLVIVFARGSSLSLDEISDEMSKLNATRPAYSWPDMVAVDGKGIINYATRVPGDDHLGDFILPVEDHSPNGLTAPLYVFKAIRSAGRHTFNKVAALLAARVSIFAPGTVIAKYDTELEEISRNCVVTDTHQFNLKGELRRLSDAELVNEMLPTDIYGIVLGKNEVGSIQYRRWQDGGFLTLRGKFPIEPFLMFLRGQVPNIPPKSFQFIRRSSVQVSMVLPFTEHDFLRSLMMFQQRSQGIAIRKDTRKLLIQKYADEGMSSPYHGRLMYGLLKVRDTALSDADRQPFDKFFDSTFTALIAVRDAAATIRTTWEGHRDKVASGAIIVEQGRQIQVTETIDKTLKKESETLITGAVRTLKSCMQAMAGHLGADIGFLFKKETAFKTGLAALAQTDPALAAYIEDARLWTEALILIRNEEIEHGLGADFRVSYKVEGKMEAREPDIRGEPLTAFAARVLDRLGCFVEEVTMHLLQKRMPAGIGLTEVAPGARTSSSPERFKTTPSVGGLPSWKLTPHRRRFEDC